MAVGGTLIFPLRRGIPVRRINGPVSSPYSEHLLLLPGLFGASVLGAFMGDQGGMGAFGMGAGVSFILYLVGIVVYAILGGIGFAIEAWFYNIVASIVGGIEIELS